MERSYRMASYEIIEQDGELQWVTWENDAIGHCTAGPAWVEDEVLNLGSSTTRHREGRFKDYQELLAYFGSLPVWDRTLYYVREGFLPLRYCQTGRLV